MVITRLEELNRKAIKKELESGIKIPLLAQGGFLKDGNIIENPYIGSVIPQEKFDSMEKIIPLENFKYFNNHLEQINLSIKNRGDTSTMAENKPTTDIVIEWIDNRFHVSNIKGVPTRKLIVRELKDLLTLADNLKLAVKNFNQAELISTKKNK